MMTFLRWMAAVPIIATAVLFALAHPQPVDFYWSPVNPPLTLPLYALALGLTAIGFVLGALAAWLGMSRVRRERRAQKKIIKTLEKDLAAANENIIKAREEILSAQHNNTPKIGPTPHV